MRQLPAPVRWAVTAVAVVASAGSVSGCMSVSDDSSRPRPTESVDPSGAAAAEADSGVAAPGGQHGPRGGADDPDTPGDDTAAGTRPSRAPAASAAPSAGPAASARPGGGHGADPAPGPGPGPGTGGSGGSGGGTGPSGPPPEPSVPAPPPEPTPTPTPSGEPPAPEPSEPPTASPSAETRTEALHRADRSASRWTEPAASPQIAPA
ncbi:hypothetical protein [Streptomyces kanasensis]|uniref:hypothetical protein n=1 Tax=Streptomyces kanasensis TaxID=936756 RepID=UPI00370112A6